MSDDREKTLWPWIVHLLIGLGFSLALLGGGLPITSAALPSRAEPRSEPAPDVGPREEQSSERAYFAGDKAGQERDDNGLEMTFIWCPAGEFVMGSPDADPDRLANELPQVEVQLTQGFWLARYELTQRAWREVMKSEPWHDKSSVKEGPDYPATFISWDRAREFCRKFTDRERRAGRIPVGWSYRLPTEAEWEYACRAGTTTRFGYGDDIPVPTPFRRRNKEAPWPPHLDRYAWCFRNTIDIDESYAHRIGKLRPNTWHLYDMHGNVWEWCEDGYQERLPGGKDPVAAAAGEGRTARGGSWGDIALDLRCASRHEFPQTTEKASLGFRLALSANSPKEP